MLVRLFPSFIAAENSYVVEEDFSIVCCVGALYGRLVQMTVSPGLSQYATSLAKRPKAI